MELIETSTYSAVRRGANFSILFDISVNSYPNGAITEGSGSVSFDNVFRANFEPVPFEFSPALGLSVLGGLWGLGLVAKRIKKAKSK